MNTCETAPSPALNWMEPAIDDSPRPDSVALAMPAGADLPLAVQIVRYLVVGGLAFVADLSALFVLTDVCHWHYLVSATAAFLIGMAVNYTLSIAWVFKVRTLKNRQVEFLLFSLIGLAGLGITQLLLWTMIDGLGIYYLHAKFVTAAVVLGWNFAARKLLLFTSPRAAGTQEITRL